MEGRVAFLRNNGGSAFLHVHQNVSYDSQHKFNHLPSAFSILPKEPHDFRSSLGLYLNDVRKL